MKKLFAASLILTAIICFSFQNRDSILVGKGPSVFSSNSASDSTDLDEQMQVLEKEMKIWEEKMKPYEKERQAQEGQMKPYEKEMKVWQDKMKPLEQEMRDLEKKMKNATTDKERESISEQMSNVGDRLGMVGDEMGKVGMKMNNVGGGMEKYGEEMSKIGEEMGKIGEKMGVIGEKMEIRHKRIFTWFFQELKKEGLVTEGKCSIVMEENFFIVNSKYLSKDQLQQYKKGIEQRLGKPLKAEFSIYFKGSLESVSDKDFDFDGTQNCNY
jgi:chromosome segregation ATPase